MTLPDPDSFLSGERWAVRRRQRPLARAADAAADLRLRLGGAARRIDELAAATPARDVLVLSADRPGSKRIAAAVAELRRSAHRVEVALAGTAGGGKFHNLNAVLAGRDPADWTLVVDDDVELPPRFLDRFVALCERFDLALAQPAQTLDSHGAWRVTRRRAGSLVRETRFVEIGPVTAFRREAAAELLPFPDLRFGWGLDLHWAALGAERGWRLGIVDATPVRHAEAPVATAYPSEEAIAEAQRFLADRPYLDSDAAQETLAVHRSL